MTQWCLWRTILLSWRYSLIRIILRGFCHQRLSGFVMCALWLKVWNQLIGHIGYGEPVEVDTSSVKNVLITGAGSYIAEIIASAANHKVVFADPDAVDLANRTPIAKQVLSSKKLESLGWHGAFSAEIGIKHTLDILQGK